MSEESTFVFEFLACGIFTGVGLPKMIWRRTFLHVLHISRFTNIVLWKDFAGSMVDHGNLT